MPARFDNLIGAGRSRCHFRRGARDTRRRTLANPFSFVNCGALLLLNTRFYGIFDNYRFLVQVAAVADQESNKHVFSSLFAVLGGNAGNLQGVGRYVFQNETGVLFATVTVVRIEGAFVGAVLDGVNRCGVSFGCIREVFLDFTDVFLRELGNALLFKFRIRIGAVHWLLLEQVGASADSYHSLVKTHLVLQAEGFHVCVQRIASRRRGMGFSAGTAQSQLVGGARGLVLFGTGGTLVSDFVHVFGGARNVYAIGISAVGAEKGECARNANVKLLHCCSPLCF